MNLPCLTTQRQKCSHILCGSRVEPFSTEKSAFGGLHLHLHLGDLADTFIQTDLQRFLHTFTHQRRCQPCKATASSSGAVRVRCLAQGHLDTRRGWAGDWTSKPALPPELSQPPGVYLPFYHPSHVLCSLTQCPMFPWASYVFIFNHREAS